MNLELIVIDTNILISAVLNPDGTAYQAFEKAVENFTLIQTDESYQEIAQRIYKPKFDRYISNQRREDFLNNIVNKSKFIKTTLQINDCRDSDDNKFLEMAIEFNARFLITGDKDLLSLKKKTDYQKLIVTARDFVDLLI